MYKKRNKFQKENNNKFKQKHMNKIRKEIKENYEIGIEYYKEIENNED